jgi:hypothetical protein
MLIHSQIPVPCKASRASDPHKVDDRFCLIHVQVALSQFGGVKLFPGFAGDFRCGHAAGMAFAARGFSRSFGHAWAPEIVSSFATE